MCFIFMLHEVLFYILHISHSYDIYVLLYIYYVYMYIICFLFLLDMSFLYHLLLYLC